MEILNGIGQMLLIGGLAMIVVFLAMMMDLVSGLRKARQRGEVRTSQALKRTITKFITYEGSMAVAMGIDILIHLSQLIRLFGLDAIYNVPVIACLVGVFLLAVEFISIREKAEQKTKKQMSDAAQVLATLLQSDSIKDVLRTALEQNPKRGEE